MSKLTIVQTKYEGSRIAEYEKQRKIQLEEELKANHEFFLMLGVRREEKRGPEPLSVQIARQILKDKK